MSANDRAASKQDGKSDKREPSASKTTSAARHWKPLATFIEREQQLGLWAQRRGAIWLFAYEFIRFGVKQAWACLFGGAMLALLIGTYLWYPAGAKLARYDFLVIASLAIQAAMLLFKLETLEEAKVILLFHIVGTAMEIFKTAVGSWAYPEPSLLRIGGVPLFSGFMYAAIGSYIARVWRLFDFEFTRHPKNRAVFLLAGSAYVNFFTHHYTVDFRILLFGFAFILFGPTIVHYRIWKRHRSMPLLLGLFLVALFIWFAENIGTFVGAWVYPHQSSVWKPVALSKLGAWFLLMLISYALVAVVHGVRTRPARLSRFVTAGASPGLAAAPDHKA